MAVDRSKQKAVDDHDDNLINIAWLPHSDCINRLLASAFVELTDADFKRRSHFIDGRFENLYVEQDRLPGLSSVLQFALNQAGRVLHIEPNRLRIGFWLNAMEPGESTSVHSHEENDELLSGVYYVSVPRKSGNLVFHDGPLPRYFCPKPGMMLFFPPDLPHAVEQNQSKRLRLSVAFNIGLGA
ncbi:MAG TPA: hypothetical protein DDY14_13240 [Chromatiaceae bacterium]|nr:MAG: hypothetical protein N838_05560 [Thiohalocapsa sp. PB-PSB1]QQO56940.1 MAG: hypothetical protein N838_29910 [Thiohalocapsa sp. PB-PSB1]HBG96245.1 hypothetical protein [Chromatiaceae bacterium]